MTRADGQRMLGERYRIEKELGKGGMATVYLCADLTSGHRVAVKVLHPDLAGIVTRERFVREIEFAAQLRHPRIPRVTDSGDTGDLTYYAMEYVDGESLRERMKGVSRFPVEEALRIARGILEPLGFAHEVGIIHRDIKPENVLLSGDEVHVLDFGVARAILESTGERLTETGLAVGTPAYMSPEQVLASRDLDLRSDLFSVGCVLYEMLAGTPPFTGASPHLIMSARFRSAPPPMKSSRDDVPATVEEAALRAMRLAPEERWQSAGDFSAALAA